MAVMRDGTAGQPGSDSSTTDARPSPDPSRVLAGCIAVDAMPGGFPQAWEQMARQSVRVIRAAMLTAATDRQEAHIFLAKAARQSLSRLLPEAQAACLAVLGCYFPTPAEAAESRDLRSEAHNAARVFPTALRLCDRLP